MCWRDGSVLGHGHHCTETCGMTCAGTSYFCSLIPENRRVRMQKHRIDPPVVAYLLAVVQYDQPRLPNSYRCKFGIRERDNLRYCFGAWVHSATGTVPLYTFTRCELYDVRWDYTTLYRSNAHRSVRVHLKPAVVFKVCLGARE